MTEGKYKIPAGSPIHYCKLCACHVYWIETGRRRKLPVDPDGRGHVCLGKIKVNWREKL